MRMLARRLLLLAAVLRLLTALAAGLAPQPGGVDPPSVPRAAQSPEIVERSISASQDDQSVQARPVQKVHWCWKGSSRM